MANTRRSTRSSTQSEKTLAAQTPTVRTSEAECTAAPTPSIETFAARTPQAWTSSTQLTTGQPSTNPALGTLHPRITSYLPSEVTWSNADLPDKLFQLDPGAEWGNETVTPFFKNDDGTPARDTRGHPLRDYGFLPNQISIQAETYRLEMYLGRLHSRCMTFDLFARMHPGAGEKAPSANAVNMMRIRLRSRLNIPCWTKRRETPSMVECLILEQVSWQSVQLNTVLPVGPQGLLKPTLANNNQQDVPFTSYDVPRDLSQLSQVPIPITTYVGEGGVHMPSERLESVFDTLTELQARAFDKGYPHWIFLENHDKPTKWSMKAMNQRHSNSGPLDISVPETSTMPTAALKWIEFCVEMAVQDGNMQLPLHKLSSKTRQWVDGVIEWAEDAMIETPVEEAESANIGPDNEGEEEVSENTDWAEYDRGIDAAYQAIEPGHVNGKPLVGFNNPFTYATATNVTNDWNNGLQYEQQSVGWNEGGAGQPTMQSGFNPAVGTGIESFGDANMWTPTPHEAALDYMGVSNQARMRLQGQEMYGHTWGGEMYYPPPQHKMVAPVAYMERQQSTHNWVPNQSPSAFHQNGTAFQQNGLISHHDHGPEEPRYQFSEKPRYELGLEGQNVEPDIGEQDFFDE